MAIYSIHHKYRLYFLFARDRNHAFNELLLIVAFIQNPHLYKTSYIKYFLSINIELIFTRAQLSKIARGDTYDPKQYDMFSRNLYLSAESFICRLCFS